ncbi:nitroreductase family protein [Vallitalea okinawensis]|uniref:nitroreductase family protein n=1 Tax=Vallitalea okinawensis TaxID=2078660 RepID=UPI000CFC473A|nr:nitroreductase family protein [Vallitalea okinawensis]
MNEIFIRRSIRKYDNQPVEKEKIDQLIRAAMQAPSAGNQQPWEMIIVQNKEMLKKLSLMSPYSKMIEKASVAFVFLGNENVMKYPENWEQDLSAATQNLLLQAVELDLGAVWLGVAPLENRMQYIKDLFQLPDHVKAFSVVPVGYSDQNKFTDRYDPTKVHYEVY